MRFLPLAGPGTPPSGSPPREGPPLDWNRRTLAATSLAPADRLSPVRIRPLSNVRPPRDKFALASVNH